MAEAWAPHRPASAVGSRTPRGGTPEDEGPPARIVGLARVVVVSVAFGCLTATNTIAVTLRTDGSFEAGHRTFLPRRP